MPRISIIEHDAASPQVQALYLDFQSRMSFPAAPNFIKAQGHSATVTSGTWDLVRNVLVMGEIPRYIKEMLFVAISKDRRCRYCEAAHIACCRMLGVAPALLDNLTGDINLIHDAKLRDIIFFGLKCSRNPQSLTEADMAGLRAHGLNESKIVEIIAMSGLAVYANIMADATAVDADGMFETVSAPAAERAP